MYILYLGSRSGSRSARCARTIAPCSLRRSHALLPVCDMLPVCDSHALLLVCDILCAAQAVRYVVDLVLTKMVKVWGVLEFYFLEW